MGTRTDQNVSREVKDKIILLDTRDFSSNHSSNQHSSKIIHFNDIEPVLVESKEIDTITAGQKQHANLKENINSQQPHIIAASGAGGSSFIIQQMMRKKTESKSIEKNVTLKFLNQDTTFTLSILNDENYNKLNVGEHYDLIIKKAIGKPFIAQNFTLVYVDSIITKKEIPINKKDLNNTKEESLGPKTQLDSGAKVSEIRDSVSINKN